MPKMPTIRITIKFNKERIALAVDDNATVAELKQLLARKTGVPADRQTLLRKHRKLRDDKKSLRDCKVKDKSRLHLIGSKVVLPSPSARPPPSQTFRGQVYSPSTAVPVPSVLTTPTTSSSSASHAAPLQPTRSPLPSPRREPAKLMFSVKFKPHQETTQQLVAKLNDVEVATDRVADRIKKYRAAIGGTDTSTTDTEHKQAPSSSSGGGGGGGTNDLKALRRKCEVDREACTKVVMQLDGLTSDQCEPPVVSLRKLLVKRLLRMCDEMDALLSSRL